MTIVTIDVAVEPVALDPERVGLAQECIFEIDELIKLLLNKIATEELSVEIPDALLLRSIGVRIQDLSLVAMAVLGDEIYTTADLKKRVWGVLSPS